MDITLVIIIITSLISILAFSNQELYGKLILWPARMDNPVEYYRLLTSGFIHADYMHLFFNMFTLYFIGHTVVEPLFDYMGNHSLYPVLYLTGIIVSSLPSFISNRHNSYYRSLGASGGVSAVLFASVYLMPWAKIDIWFIGMPNILFALLYLGYSFYMSRNGGDNVNHNAHYIGAIYGFIFTFLVDPYHGANFIDQIMHPSFQ